MNRMASLLRWGSAPISSSPADKGFSGEICHVAAIYEGEESLARVRVTFDSLSRLLRPAVGLTFDAWSFDMLGRLDIRAVATRDASESHVLMLACDPCAALPAQVLRWLEDSLGAERVSPLSVVLLNGRWAASRGADPLSQEISGLARRMGVDLVFDWEFESYFANRMTTPELR